MPGLFRAAGSHPSANNSLRAGWLFLGCLVLTGLGTGNSDQAEAVVASGGVVERLQEVHRQRRDVRYAFGGCDDLRMDCSCFVQTAFEDAFGRRLPRTTLSQTRFFESELLPRLTDIRRLAPATLCPGDLIYTFRGDRWETAPRHVAIYYQDGRILHSASGLGVGVQSLDVLSHHKLHGVVRLFECRDPGPNSGSKQPEPPSPTRGPLPGPNNALAEAESQKAVRQLVDDLFQAWFRRDRRTFASLWGEGALQWRQGSAGDESSVLSDWRKTFDELAGRRWRYGIRELQTRGDTAFVEVGTEYPCLAPEQGICSSQIQTFVWRLGADGGWRIVQHELGSAQ